MHQDTDHRSPGSGSAFAGTHEELSRQINELIGTTEEHFISIGLKIQEISERASSITGKALTASRILAGDDLVSAVNGLGEMIDQLEDIFRRVDAVSDSNLESLGFIAFKVRSMEKELGGLGDTSRNLKMLALSTKIQSTQTGRGSSDFMQLGLDIGKMSETISSKAKDLLAETSALSGFVREVGSGLHEIRDRQKYQTSSVLEWSRNIIHSMSEMNSMSRKGSERIRNGINSISGSVSDVVTSVQYQDISKQALEKVLQGFEGMPAAGLKPTAEGESTPTSVDEETGEILRTGQYLVQSRALDRVGDLIGDALRTVITGMESIASSISSMTAVTRAVDRDCSRFQGDLETAAGSVRSFLMDVVQSNREMSESMSSLGSTVEGMSVFTKDIEMISTEVELISLNARVMAAQAGAEGLGMGVIADAVKVTAGESDSQRGSVVTLLEKIASTSSRLKEELQNTASGDEEKLDQLMRELGVFLDTLRMMQKKIVGMLCEIDQHGGEVINSIESVIEEVREHLELSKRSSEIAANIRELAVDRTMGFSAAQLILMTGEGAAEVIVEDMDPLRRLELLEAFISGQTEHDLTVVPPEGSAEDNEVIFFDSCI